MKPLALAICYFSLIASAFAQVELYEPIPIELAFHARDFSAGERSLVSPDGVFVVYSVKDPEARRGAARVGVSASGMPASGDGVSIWLSNITNGETRAVSPAGASAIRPSWSPDGKRIAFYCDEGGLLRLWLFDITENKAKKISDAAVKAHASWGDAPVWSPDGGKLLVPVAPEANSKNNNKPASPHVYLSGELYMLQGVPEDPIAKKMYHENAAAFAWIQIESGASTSAAAPEGAAEAQRSPSGMFISYLTAPAPAGPNSMDTIRDLIICDPSGTVVFTEKGIPSDDADLENPPYSWHPSDDRLFYYSQKRVWVRDFSKERGKDAHKLADGLGEADRRFLKFTKDGSALVLALRPEGATPEDVKLGVQALLFIPLKTELVGAFSYPSNIRIVKLMISNGASLWQKDTKHIAAVLRDLNTGDLSIVQIDLETGAIEYTKTGRFRAIPVGAAAGGPILQFEDAKTPADLYQYSENLKNPRRVTRVEKRFDQYTFGEVAAFTTTVADYEGKPIKAYSSIQFPPSRRPGVVYPVIVSVHGGARLSRSAEQFGGGTLGSMPASIFTSRGFAVLFVDSLMGPEGKAGNPIQELKDTIIPQILHAADLGYIDMERVGVMGHSYGGYSTAALLSASPLFRAGVSVGGMYDLCNFYSWMDDNNSNFNIRWAENGEGRMAGSPWTDFDRYFNNSPYYRASRFTAPLMMIHGEADAAAAADAKKMFQALKSLGKSAELALYANEGGAVADWSDAAAFDAAERAAKFFGKLLKGD